MIATKLGFFVAAAFFAGWALVSNGAPLAPVIAGIAAVGGYQAWARRRSSKSRG